MNVKSLLSIINNISNDAFLSMKILLNNIDVIDDPLSMTSLYNGLSGLALLETDIFSYSKKKKNLERAEYYLSNSFNIINKYKSKFNSGLFIGMAGHAWAECRFTEATGHKGDRAIKILNYILTKEKINHTKTHAYDIIRGDAGKGITFLYGYELFNNKKYFTYSRKIAQNMISNGSKYGVLINDYYSNNSKLLSFSHGASGIIYFLYKLSLFTKDDKLNMMVNETINLLTNKMEITGNYALWQEDIKKNYVTPYWCSGTSGICLLFTKIHNEIGDYSNIIRMAVNSVNVAASGSNTYGLCHGLAGIGEFIIEAENVTGISFKDEKDRVLNFILSEYLNKRQMRYEKIVNPKISTEFMTGYPGIAHFILRYLDPSIKHFSLL